MKKIAKPISQYRIVFDGQVLSGHNPAKVALRLARAFAVDASKLAPFFDRRAVFVRENLNSATLSQYAEVFRNAGARLHTVPQVQAQLQLPTNDRIEKRARHGIQIATIWLVIVFFLDELAQFIDLDMGYIPYLLGFVLLTYGGWNMALVKGFSPLVGLLGLLGLPGMSILVLLPDRQGPYRLHRARVFAIILLLVGVGLFVELGLRRQALSDYREAAQKVGATRGDFPAQQLVSGPLALAQERDAVRLYVSQGMALVAEHNFRPNETTLLCDAMFREVSDYLLWLRYQKHLHYQFFSKKPAFLGTSKPFEEEQAWKGFLKRQASPENLRLLLELNNWFGTSQQAMAMNEAFRLTSELLLVTKALEKGEAPTTDVIATSPHLDQVELDPHGYALVRTNISSRFGTHHSVVFGVHSRYFLPNAFLTPSRVVDWVGGDLPGRFLASPFWIMRESKTQRKKGNLGQATVFKKIVIIPPKSTKKINREERIAPLFSKILSGDQKFVNAWISQSKQPLDSRYLDQTALAFASQTGQLAIANALLKAGANPNLRMGRTEQTALMLAITRGHRDLVALLLQHGAAVNAKEQKTRRTPLMYAARRGAGDISKLLLAHQANWRWRDDDCKLAEHYVPATQAGRQVLDALQQTPGYHAETQPLDALFNAVSRGQEQRLADLLIQKVDLEQRNKNCDTALHLAIRRKKADLAELLLLHGADPQALDKRGRTALVLAAYRGNLKIVKILLDAGAEVNFRTQLGSALVVAARYNHIKVVQWLARNGADMERDGAVALLANLNLTRSDKIALLLLQKKINLAIVNEVGDTLLGKAVRRGRLAIVQVLINKGVDPEQKSQRKTPLQWAVMQGHKAIVKLLVAHVTPSPQVMRTLVQTAHRKNYREIEALLKAKAALLGYASTRNSD